MQPPAALHMLQLHQMQPRRHDSVSAMGLSSCVAVDADPDAALQQQPQDLCVHFVHSQRRCGHEPDWR